MEKILGMKKYSSYNLITKENDVIILSYEDYDKLPQDIKREVKFIMAIKKDLVDFSDKPPKWFIDFANKQEEYWAKQLMFNEIIVKRIDSLEHRLDHLVKKNNLKE